MHVITGADGMKSKGKHEAWGFLLHLQPDPSHLYVVQTYY